MPICSIDNGFIPEDAENIASVASTVSSLYGKQEISCTISTRETLAESRIPHVRISSHSCLLPFSRID